MKKTYAKDGANCRVTFTIPAEVGADTVALCGEFNGWDAKKHPMKKRKDGSFSTTISLQPGSTYRFRYWVNNSYWENDWEADDYISNEFGSEDSVVNV